MISAGLRIRSAKRTRNLHTEHLILQILILITCTASVIAQPQIGWVPFEGDPTSGGCTNNYLTRAEFALAGFSSSQMIGGINPVQGQWIASLHGGYAIPYGVYSNYYDPGYGLFVDVEKKLGNNFSVIGLIGYTYFNGMNLVSASIDDTHWISININAQYRHRISGPFSSYYRAGPGRYIPENGPDKYGINAGAGIQYDANSFLSLAAGVDYHLILQGMNFQGISAADIDKDVQFALLHAGLLFYFP